MQHVKRTIGRSIDAILPAIMIALEPSDWHWATWRKTSPLDLKKAAPFDKDDCVQRLSTKVLIGKKRWDFSPAGLAPSMSKEEARFWLEAMLDDSGERPKELAKDLATKKLAPMSLAQLKKRFQEEGRSAPFDLPIVLANLFTPEEVVELFLSSKPETYGFDGGGVFLQSLQKHFFPRLTEAERKALKKRIAPKVVPKKFPSDYYDEPPGEFLVAAMLGMHDELEAVVDSWLDNRYGDEAWHDSYHVPQIIIFGLGSGELVERHMRRLKLKLHEPHYMRAWLAHTETRALDWPVQTIVQTKNKDVAASLANVLALVKSKENTEPMLAIKKRSKAPQVAAAWLDAQGGSSSSAATKPKTKVAIAKAPPWLTKAAAKLKPAAVPPWLNVAKLPALLIEGDKALGEEQVTALVSALAGSSLEKPHVLVTAIREHATPASRDAFAWELFEEWLTRGAPAKDRWTLGAIGLLGGDESALKLAAKVRAWPGESQHQRAVFGLDVLGAIGSDVALVQLAGIAQKLKFAALKQQAGEVMDRIAKARKLSRDELEDRIVPDGVGLAAKALKDITKIQITRLEQAMVKGREWKAADFETFLVKHPLLRPLVGTLVWSAGGKTTFRVAEDGTYANEKDVPYKLPKTAKVQIAHPLDLSAKLRESWGTIFGDYEILTPFPQLGRPIHQLAPKEAKEDNLAPRFAKREWPARAFAGMLKTRGWQHGSPGDGGYVTEHLKELRGLTVVIEHNGYGIGGFEYTDPQEISTIYFLPSRDSTKRLKLGKVDARVLSEVLYDLT